MFDEIDDDEKDLREKILEKLMGEMRGGSIKDIMDKKKGPDGAIRVVEASGDIPEDKIRDMLHAKIGESDDDEDEDTEGLDEMEREGDVKPDVMEALKKKIGMAKDDSYRDEDELAGMDKKEESMAGSNPYMRKIMAARMKRKMG